MAASADVAPSASAAGAPIAATPVSPPGPSGLEAIKAAHARLLADKRIQFDFTAPPKPDPPKPPHPEPEWLKALEHFIGQGIDFLLPLLKVVFWVGVAALVALLVFLILREVMGVRFSRKRRATARVKPVDWRPDASKALALLEDADALADQGRYDEAVHLILYRSIDDIEGRRPRLVRPALTARDIAALEAVPGAARNAFTLIARVVEASFFGGRSVDRDAFAACRKAYEDFAFPEVWA